MCFMHLFDLIVRTKGHIKMKDLKKNMTCIKKKGFIENDEENTPYFNKKKPN